MTETKLWAIMLALLSGIGIVALAFGVWGALLSVAYAGHDFLPYVLIAVAGLLIAGLFGILAVRTWRGKMLSGEGTP
ncbi:hypothetical protein MF271_23700 (plasmid) [Deinococcus sp. KNUC1210]|uniref:hypothetical protein n=1 Tax=Deinococcus sp. KNUC1210 TaxID=2917691 RepID=UPI001EF1279F|nr:hypothetical protein [Deinococcus sp. KNUC1210]ULH17969.1 hypothetical protein MF271_23700 [Deinococcus sp. KNUC1210]